MPKGVSWIKEKAAIVDPDNNKVVLGNGDEVTYDYVFDVVDKDFYSIESTVKLKNGQIKIHGLKRENTYFLQVVSTLKSATKEEGKESVV